MPVLLRPEAAKQLRISVGSLTTLIRKGLIKQVHLTDQRRGILQSEIDAYLQSKIGGAA